MTSISLPAGIPASDMPSPTESECSVASQPIEPDAALRSNVRRSTSRLPLRTSFRQFSGISRIIVGEPGNRYRPATEYLVHRELLTSASPFFAAALNGAFAEGLDQTVCLPEEKPEIFEWFLQWLYTGTLKTTVPHFAHYHHGHIIQYPPTAPHKQHNTPAAPPAAHGTPLGPTPPERAPNPVLEHDRRTDGDLRNSQGSPKYFLLLDLYALSDRLLTTPLSNEVLSTIARLSESTNSVPTPSDTWLLYGDEAHDPRATSQTPLPTDPLTTTTTPPGLRDNSPARALVLDLFVYKKTDRLLETHRDAWHPRFLRDLCVKLKRPGPEALDRHAPTLVPWSPAAWPAARPCEMCHRVLGPDAAAERCAACAKVFCASCLKLCARGAKVVFPADTSGCRPWAGRGMCLRYHEHEDGEACEG